MSPAPESGGPPAAPPVKKSQKEMTKAERKALQEAQRAAKAARLEQQQAQKASGSKPATSNQNAKSSSSSKPPAGSSKPSMHQRRMSIAASGAADDETPKYRGLRIFSHFGLPKAPGHQIKGDIHPAIIRLGLLFSEFKISGANARCIATLTAFKAVIQDYHTPAHNTLSRHLMTHLSPQITHLVSARPMSVTMGNAIRQLKLEISGSDIDLPEQDAKDALCARIDDYIRERIITADEVIEDIAGKKIKDGDVILVYARSSVVEKVLLHAHEEGKKFSVVVVDSRPLLEGKFLLRTLTAAGIQCTYTLLPALPSVLTEASMVLLGAHSLHSNGAVYSRAGTAMVAMLAKQYGIPVVVCCETYKFSEGLMLDGFGKNELAPPKFSQSATGTTATLEVLEPLYDLTPPTCVTAVVTEVGLIPPSSISSIPLAMGRSTL
ncbi:hypothetical protein EV122DRAFT_261148 [Schizophyllum commune]